MRPNAGIHNADGRETLELDTFHTGLRVIDWADEPATEAQLSILGRLGCQPVRPLTTGRAAHLIGNLEDYPQRAQASAENGVREITKRQAHLLQHAVEEARRAVQGATKDNTE